MNPLLQHAKTTRSKKNSSNNALSEDLLGGDKKNSFVFNNPVVSVKATSNNGCEPSMTHKFIRVKSDMENYRW